MLRRLTSAVHPLRRKGRRPTGPTNPNDELDDFLERIKPMSDAEKSESLLGYFRALINRMTTADLVMPRFKPATA